MFIRRNSKRQAFTLIELLVIVAIIAILAAILFPVFARAREKSRSASCLSNLKQIGVAIMQYEQDYNETTPNGVNPYGGGNGWAGQIYPYIKSTVAFHCPNDKASGVNFGSYGYNKNVALPSPNAPDGSPTSYTISQYNQPSRTILLFEVTNSKGYDVTLPSSVEGADTFRPYFGGSPAGNGNGGAYDPGGFNAQPQAGTPNDGFIKYATGYMNGVATSNQGSYQNRKGRHNGGSNFLFVDGHSRWLHGTQVSPGYNAPFPGATQAPGGSSATAAGTSGTFADGTRPAATFSIK